MKIISLSISMLLLPMSLYSADNHLHMANGVKIGEVDSSSAILWTRLTKTDERNVDGKLFSTKHTKKMRSEPYGALEKMEGSVPGVSGEVSLHYWPKGRKADAIQTAWVSVDPEKDFTQQIKVNDLLAGETYAFTLEGRKTEKDAVAVSVNGGFRTAPSAGTIAPIRFGVVTCQDYPRRDDPLNGHKIYHEMAADDLDFFVHAGDILYYDKPGPYADNEELARFKWNRIFSLPYQRNFHNHTSSYFMKDDHELLKNDAWPGQKYGDLTWEQGLAVFREQVPMGEKTYRTVRWGKDLQVWMVEGRDFRSDNTMKDGPNKTIWGQEQKQWFFDTVNHSDAAFKILISPTPLVGPDKGWKKDNHANPGFKHEGDELRDFIGKHKDLFLVCGDRHWQYISVDPVSGTREYSVGSASDAHATGYTMKQRTPMHEYLKIKGGYFTVDVRRKNNVPQMSLRHHGVDGSIYHQDIYQNDKGIVDLVGREEASSPIPE